MSPQALGEMLRITTRRGIEATASPTVPAPNILGYIPTVNDISPPNPPPAGLAWPTQSPSYRSALPGVASFGMESFGGGGRHMTTPATTIILIDSLASSNTGSAQSGLGPNVFAGTFEYAWRHTASPKIMIPIISGVPNLGKIIPSPTAHFVSYWGQFAPSPGFFLRNTVPRFIDAENSQIWHFRSYCGDDIGIALDQKDAFSTGGGGTIDSNVYINCEFAWGSDETLDGFRPSSNVTFIYCAFIDPLHLTGHPKPDSSGDHGYGILLGGESGRSSNQSIMRCMFAHTAARNPLTNTTTLMHSNNLHYNHGLVGGGAGVGVQYHPTADNGYCSENIIGNLFVRGPNNNASLVAARCNINVASGSGAYLTDNAQNGWTSPSSQSGFMTSSPSGFVVGTPRSDSTPPAWGGSTLTGMLRWAESPLSATSAEKLDFIKLMRESVGAQPAYQSTSYGRVSAILNQIVSRINGNVSTVSQFSNSVGDAGGWFSISSVTVNPLSPGVHWHGPLPTSNRDQILTSGTLSNGMSAVGYTRLEAWALNQHYFVGGK